jgi:hypothetical protein
MPVAQAAIVFIVGSLADDAALGLRFVKDASQRDVLTAGIEAGASRSSGEILAELRSAVDLHLHAEQLQVTPGDPIPHVVGCIADFVAAPGLLNADPAAIKAAWEGVTATTMGVGFAQQPEDGSALIAQDLGSAAARMAITDPRLQHAIGQANSVILNVTGGPNLMLSEVNGAAEVIYDAAPSSANVVIGTVVREAGKGVRVTVLAGIEEHASTHHEVANARLAGLPGHRRDDPREDQAEAPCRRHPK